MAPRLDFPKSPHAVLEPDTRWFPADEALRDAIYEKLMPPLMHKLRRKVKIWRESGYYGATETSVAPLN